MLKRLIRIFITLIGVSFISFSLIYLAPGDPIRTMYLASGNMPNEEIIEKTREAMGFNDPFHIQYSKWLINILKGDLGNSYSLNRPVSDIVFTRLNNSLKLAISSLLLMILISLPLGILSAVKENKLTDYIIRFYTFLGISMPGFLVGTILLYVVALRLKLIPVIAVGGGLEMLILPSITLAFSMSAKYIRQIREIVIEELQQGYVIGAKTRGIKFSQILIKDIIPNTLPPLVTLLALSFGSLLSGVAVVEVIFSYPGIGSLAVSAISSYDYPLIQAYVLLISLIYMSVNLLVDMSYKFLDPRISRGI